MLDICFIQHPINLSDVGYTQNLLSLTSGVLCDPLHFGFVVTRAFNILDQVFQPLARNLTAIVQIERMRVTLMKQ